MITIALVQQNKCNFTRMDEFVPPLLYEIHSPYDTTKLNELLNNYIWSEMEPYIKFIKIFPEDLIESVCENIIDKNKSYDDFMFLTEGSYSTPKKYLEFIYAKPKRNNSKEINAMNNIGCLLSLKHNIIENSCVVFANEYSSTSPNGVLLTNITKDDLIDVIRKRYFNSAVLIHDNEIIQYNYQNPVFLASTIFNLNIETDSVVIHRFTHMKYDLIYYSVDDNTKYVNQIATRMHGTSKFYGDILVFSELGENVYADISAKEICDLNLLSYGKMSDRELTVGENFASANTDPDLPKENRIYDSIWVKYLIVKNRIAKLDITKCMNCNKEIANKKINCNYCYRMYYCSQKCCKENFVKSHYKECIYT